MVFTGDYFFPPSGMFKVALICLICNSFHNRMHSILPQNALALLSRSRARMAPGEQAPSIRNSIAATDLVLEMPHFPLAGLAWHIM